jgi:hypothetical protein
MTWYTRVQMYIKVGTTEAFVPRVQIWLYNPDSRQQFLQIFAYHLVILERT